MMIRRVVMAAWFGLVPMAACAAPSVCLSVIRIDHTDPLPDDSALMITMRDHSVYRAAMVGRCSGLYTDTRGYTWEPNPGTDDVCSNLLTIRLNTTGAVCLVGEIKQVTPPRH
jgi:hypothetical protein